MLNNLFNLKGDVAEDVSVATEDSRHHATFSHRQQIIISSYFPA